MKTSTSIQNEPVTPLFHIVPEDDDDNDDFTTATLSKSAPAVNQTPFTELMLHPDKLEAAFKIAKMENDAFEASRKFGRSPVNPGTRTDSRAHNLVRPPSRHSRTELKITGFYLAAPSAKSVKLAADFTNWEKFPLDLIKSEDGLWYADVPLPPGQYAYRFIVDDQWRDDPHPTQLVPNPFGTVNAVMKVS